MREGEARTAPSHLDPVVPQLIGRLFRIHNPVGIWIHDDADLDSAAIRIGQRVDHALVSQQVDGDIDGRLGRVQLVGHRRAPIVGLDKCPQDSRTVFSRGSGRSRCRSRFGSRAPEIRSRPRTRMAITSVASPNRIVVFTGFDSPVFRAAVPAAGFLFSYCRVHNEREDRSRQ